MLDLVAKFLTVLGVGVLEIFAAVPAGFVLALDPAVVFAASTSGGVIGVVAMVFVGGRVRGWLLKVRGKGGDGKGPVRARRIWERYGVVGFGLFGPLLLGAPLCAALGMALGGRGSRVAVWTSVGVALWCAILTGAIALGILSAGSIF